MDLQVGDKVRMTPHALPTLEGEVVTISDQRVGLKIPGSQGCLALPCEDYIIEIIKRAPSSPAADPLGTWRCDSVHEDLYHKVGDDKWLNTSTGESYSNNYVRSNPIVAIEIGLPSSKEEWNDEL